MSEVDRRRFLERMTALGATALVAPGSLGSRIQRSGPAPEAAARPVRLPAGVSAPQEDPAAWTLVEAAAAIRRGDLTSEALVSAFLERIERWDGTYRAFNTVRADAALTAARRVDAAGAAGALDGIPLAIKDNFFTAGVETTANSFLFEGFVPDFDATAWARLRSAGAILLGKTQMGPLATTAATTPTGERTTVNAWAPFDEDVGPGGSSSGSATAVAARLASCGTGTQTGGSITNPSMEQGLTGIKPTMGRVSLHGIIPLTYTRDHVGPLARDARDAAVMLAAMAGPDPADPRTAGLPPVPDYVAAVEPVDRRGRPALRRPLTVGVLPGYLDPPEPPPERSEAGDPDEDRIGSSPPRARASRQAYLRDRAEIAARGAMLDAFRDLGAVVVEVPFPADWETLTSWDFNNVRLPERSEIFLEHLRDDVRGFGVSLSPWINGLLLPAAEYVRGSRARWILLRAILDDLLSRCDVVVQTAPFPFDMVGLPLIAFPIGFEEGSAGVPRPIGALVGGQPYAEDRLLEAAAAYQRVTDWHRRRPAEPDALRTGSGASGGGPARMDLFDVMDLGE